MTSFKNDYLITDQCFIAVITTIIIIIIIIGFLTSQL